MKQRFISKILILMGIGICLATLVACAGNVSPSRAYSNLDHSGSSITDIDEAGPDEMARDNGDQASGAFHATVSGNRSTEIPEPIPVLSFTLEQAIERGLIVNPRIRAVEADRRGAISDIGRQRGDFFPTLSAQAGYTSINSIDAKGRADPDYLDQEIGTINFRLSQPIFAGMTIFNAYQKTKLAEERIKKWQELVENELVLEIQLYFLDLLKAREDVRSLRDAVHRLETNVEAAEAFHERQMASYSQVLLAQVDLADVRQQLSQAENMVDTTQVRLNILLDFSAHRQIDYVGRLEKGAEFTKSFDECIDLAYAQRPEMQVSQKGIEMAEKDKKIALGRFSPRLNATIDYHIRDIDYDEPGTDMFAGEFDRDQRNTYWTAGMLLQWEFGLGGQQFYHYSRTIHEIDRLEQNRRETSNQITAEVRTYYMTVQETNERIETTRTAVAYAREGYSMASKRMELRMGTILELLDAQARLSRAEANYNQAIGDHLSSLARLYHAMGQDNHLPGRKNGRL